MPCPRCTHGHPLLRPHCSFAVTTHICLCALIPLCLDSSVLPAASVCLSACLSVCLSVCPSISRSSAAVLPGAGTAAVSVSLVIAAVVIALVSGLLSLCPCISHVLLLSLYPRRSVSVAVPLVSLLLSLYLCCHCCCRCISGVDAAVTVSLYPCPCISGVAATVAVSLFPLPLCPWCRCRCSLSWLSSLHAETACLSVLRSPWPCWRRVPTVCRKHTTSWVGGLRTC